MEENFNLNDSQPIQTHELYLNPTLFTKKIPRIGNNQIIWPPPKISHEPFEIELPTKSFATKIATKITDFTSKAKKKGLENMREFIISLPGNVYSGVTNTGSLAYKSAKNLYDYYKWWKKPKEVEGEAIEKLEDGWVFVLHSLNHNDLIEDLRKKHENPEIIFTQQNILLKKMNNFARNSSILTENAEGKLDELWEFNEVYSKMNENDKEDTFSLMDKVQDYDDLDYAVPMREEDINRLFEEYIKNNPEDFKMKESQEEIKQNNEDAIRFQSFIDKCHVNNEGFQSIIMEKCLYKNQEAQENSNEFKNVTIEKYPVLWN